MSQQNKKEKQHTTFPTIQKKHYNHNSMVLAKEQMNRSMKQQFRKREICVCVCVCLGI